MDDLILVIKTHDLEDSHIFSGDEHSDAQCPSTDAWQVGAKRNMASVVPLDMSILCLQNVSEIRGNYRYVHQRSHVQADIGPSLQLHTAIQVVVSMSRRFKTHSKGECQTSLVVTDVFPMVVTMLEMTIW